MSLLNQNFYILAFNFSGCLHSWYVEA